MLFENFGNCPVGAAITALTCATARGEKWVGEGKDIGCIHKKLIKLERGGVEAETGQQL